MSFVLSRRRPPAASSPWELAAETIAVKIRWFGLLVGYVLVNLEPPRPRPAGRPQRHPAARRSPTRCSTPTTACAAGSSSAARRWSSRSWRRCSSACCATSTRGLDSPFRYYYFLSLICCAIRHASHVTYATCALHCLSYGLLYLALPPERQATWCRSC